MQSKKPRYFINTLYYTGMPLLRNGFNLLILPVITRYLLPRDFGVLSLITMITSFGGIFCLGVNAALYRLYFKYKNDIDKLRKLLSSNLLFIILSLFLYCPIIALLFPFLNNYFFKGQLRVIWLFLAFAQFALVYINTINQFIFQNNHEGKKWFLNELVATIITVCLSIGLVVTRKFTFEALIISNLCAESVKCIIIFAQLRRYYAFIFEVSFLKESLVYSWPLTPTALMGFGYSYLDRIFLSRIRGLTQVGILDLSARFSSILKIVMDGIGGVFQPISLELLSENSDNSLKKLADVSLKFVFITLSLGLFIILFSKEAIVLLTTKEYYFVIYVAPIYIYYHIFGILGYISYWLIYYHTHKTFWLVPLSAINLIANIIANIILIPRYGLIGAAFATFISSGIAQTIQFILGIRITPIPIDKYKLIALFGIVFLDTAILYFLYYLNLNLWLGIFIKLAMFSLFLLVGLAWRIFSFHDIKDILAIFRNRLGKTDTLRCL